MRYRFAVQEYCGRVPVPSYDIFNDPELKSCCAEVQINAIGRKLLDDDSHPIDHYNMGLALIATKQKSRAVQSLRRAVALDPGYEPAILALGLLLAETGELDEAAVFLSAAVALNPQKADPYKYLGMVELRRGELSSAITNLSAAHNLTPDDPAIMNELAVTHIHLGNNRRAVSYLIKALEKNPQDSQSRYWLELARKKIIEESR